MRSVSLIAAIAVSALATPAFAQLKGPCFFVEPDFKGDPMCIAPMQRLPSLGDAVKNRLMSVEIPPGVRVTICDGPNMGGSCQTLSQSVPNFTAIGAAGKIGSVASESAGAPRAAAPAPPPPPQQPPQQQAAVRPGPSAVPAPPSPPPPAPGGARPPQQMSSSPYQPAPPPPPAVTPPPPPPPTASAPPPPPAVAPPPPRPAQQASAPSSSAPGAPVTPDDETTRELRRQLVSLHKECDGGNKAACVRMGFVIGRNPSRRAQWRQDAPELFFWDN